MTRILVASIGFAVLQLGAPQPATAADLGLRGESLRPVPTSEAPSKGALTLASPRTGKVRSPDATSFAAAAPSWLEPQPGAGACGADAPARSVPASPPSLLSLPRAPPA